MSRDSFLRIVFASALLGCESLPTPSEREDPYHWEFFREVTGVDIQLLERDSEGTIYVSGGTSLFRSCDNAVSWTTVLDDKAFWGAAIESTTGLIAMGTSCYMGCASIFVSVDKGETWYVPTVRIGRTVSSLLFLDPSHIIAGFFYGESHGGSAVSHDTGKTWSYSSLDYQKRVLAIVTTPDVGVLASIEDIAALQRYLVRSVDGGHTWGDPITQIPATILRFHKHPTGRMYAIAEQPVLYYSDDQGLTWQRENEVTRKITALVSDVSGDVIAGFWSRRDTTSAPGPTLERSTDMGAHWQAITDIPFDSDITSLCVIDSLNILVGSRQDGLWKLSRRTGKL